VSLEWTERFADLWKHAPLYTKMMVWPEPQIDIAREKACATAVSMKAKYLFFLDTDVHVPRDVIQRLMKHRKPVVSGLYARRHWPPFNLMLKKVEGGYSPIGEGEYAKDSLVECDGIGMGVCLIDIEMLKVMERPYFRWTEGLAAEGASEDYYFCKKVKASGFKIFVDTSIVCPHEGAIKQLPSRNASGLFEYTNLGVFG